MFGLDLERVILMAPGFLLGITVHEFAHGYIAYRLGDPTAYHADRLNFNPLKHLDPFGTLAFLFIKFGWAKPVPVNLANLSNPRRDNVWIALAGPASNLLIAITFGILFRIFNLILPYGDVTGVFLSLLLHTVIINLMLMMFNLMPIPPLDGFHILEGLVSREMSYKLQTFERYGSMILFGIIMISLIGGINIFGRLFGPYISLFTALFTGY